MNPTSNPERTRRSLLVLAALTGLAAPWLGSVESVQGPQSSRGTLVLSANSIGVYLGSRAWLAADSTCGWRKLHHAVARPGHAALA